MNYWLFGVVTYLLCGIVVGVLSGVFPRLNIEPYDDRPPFLSYLTVVASWPIFLIVVLAHWLEGRRR